jgi:zinc transport system substrate-binding protein
MIIPFSLQADVERPTILVSVASYQAIVQEMAGQTVEVRSVVPAGVSFHSFDPTPSQVDAMHHAVLWFTIGEPFEASVMAALHSAGSAPRVVDLRAGLELLQDPYCHTKGGAADPHIWTSPKLMRHQMETIREGLVELFPQLRTEIEERSERLERKCDELIAMAEEGLGNAQGSIIVIAHAAYGYLCHDYGIKQLAIEEGGKEATMRRLADIISEAKTRGVRTVFSLKQYPAKGINRVAQTLGASVVELDAYQIDYFAGMEYAIQAIHKAVEEET